MAINEVVLCQVPDFNRPDILDVLKQVKESGFTAVQIYTFWKNFEPHAEGEFCWDYYDRQVRLLQEAGLRWVPFLLVGPKYAAPDWWLQDPRHKGLVCLEHGKESPIDSIWNPYFHQQVERVVKAFAEHYLPWNVIESFQPGICGDYGESIMPVQGNWPGDYHTHEGFWCGDEDAVASFRLEMEKKYGNIQALNKAWNGAFSSFADIRPVLPHKSTSRTAYFDQINWYRGSMTEFVDFWLATAREYFPDTPLYMCTGGNEAPEHASDFAAQAKVCARYNAGLRLTNECNRFADNFLMTAYTHTACEQYGAYFGLEPVGPLTIEGIRSRMFSSAVYGNRQMMFYYYNLFNQPDSGEPSLVNDFTKAFSDYLPLLTERKTQTDVAVFWPGYMGAFDDGVPKEIKGVLTFIRRLVQVKPVNEQMILDGALENCPLLIIPVEGFTTRETLLKVADYVHDGGKVFAVGRMTDLELEPVPEYDALFGILPESEVGMGGVFYEMLDSTYFPNLGKKAGYGSMTGFMGLHPDTHEIARCRFDPNNYSGTTTAQMANLFLREYPNGEKTGVAVAYFGPLVYEKDAQDIHAQEPILPILLADVLEKYVPGQLLHTQENEQARGYIGDDLYALTNNGDICRISGEE